MPLKTDPYKNLELSTWEKIFIPIKHFWHYAIIIGLSLQGIYTLFISLRFIFEQSSNITNNSLANIPQETVNIFASQAIINMISTGISLFLAVTIALTKNKIIKNISIILGLLFFFANTWLISNIKNTETFLLIIKPIQNLLKF